MRRLHDRACHREELVLVSSNHSSAQSPPTREGDGASGDTGYNITHINTIDGIHSQESLLSSRNLDVTQSTTEVTSSLLDLQNNNLWSKQKLCVFTSP